jgi:hypothetical protein
MAILAAGDGEAEANAGILGLLNEVLTEQDSADFS